MKPGIYPNLSNEDYHAHKDSYSRSALMEFKRSPYHYWAKYINENRPLEEKSKAMILGSAFHSYILEPHLFEEEYDLSPPYLLLKDVGRELYDNYKRQKEEILKSGKILLNVDELDMLYNMKHSLQKCKDAWALIENGRYEHSIFWQDRESGLLLKSRPDILHNNMIVDLKTTTDASPHSFQNAMVLGGYHIQGAMVREGLKILTGEDISTVINIVIEKTYPYAIGIYIIDEYALEVGLCEFKRLALALKLALEHNEWEEYTFQTIGLPKWVI